MKKGQVGDIANGIQIFAFWTVGILAFLVVGIPVYIALLIFGVVIMISGTYIIYGNGRTARARKALPLLMGASVFIGLLGLFIAVIGGTIG